MAKYVLALAAVSFIEAAGIKAPKSNLLRNAVYVATQ